MNIVEDSEVIQTRPKSKVGEYLVYDGKHEAIVSEDLFNAAQAKIIRPTMMDMIENPSAVQVLGFFFLKNIFRKL